MKPEVVERIQFPANVVMVYHDSDKPEFSYRTYNLIQGYLCSEDNLGYGFAGSNSSFPPTATCSRKEYREYISGLLESKKLRRRRRAYNSNRHRDQAD